MTEKLLLAVFSAALQTVPRFALVYSRRRGREVHRPESITCRGCRGFNSGRCAVWFVRARHFYFLRGRAQRIAAGIDCSAYFHHSTGDENFRNCNVDVVPDHDLERASLIFDPHDREWFALSAREFFFNLNNGTADSELRAIVQIA